MKIKTLLKLTLNTSSVGFWRGTSRSKLIDQYLILCPKNPNKDLSRLQEIEKKSPRNKSFNSMTTQSNLQTSCHYIKQYYFVVSFVCPHIINIGSNITDTHGVLLPTSETTTFYSHYQSKHCT